MTVLFAKFETQTSPLESTATENGKFNPADNPYPLPGDSGYRSDAVGSFQFGDRTPVVVCHPDIVLPIYGNGLWA